MKIADILNNIDNEALALPVFQRGYVWKRRQVKDLMNSLYHGYPVGALLTWTTRAELVPTRGNTQERTSAAIDLLLDGQQRITSLYGVIRGKPPVFLMEMRLLLPAYTLISILKSLSFFREAGPQATHYGWMSRNFSSTAAVG